MTLADWIPVIIAALTTLTAIFPTLGKKKAEKITAVLIDAVERWDSRDLKEDIAVASHVFGVRAALDKAVQVRTK